MPEVRRRRFRTALAGLLSAAIVLSLVACGGGGEDVGNPDSELTLAEATAPLESGAPAELIALRQEANTLLGGGVEALNERLSRLRGIPIVINVWASWCGPCRYEFPYFQSQADLRGDEIAFIGVDFEDSRDAAEQFLSELPLPFPSYFDPDREISKDLDVGPGLPNTIFIDRRGEVVYHLRGALESERQLAQYIDRYSR